MSMNIHFEDDYTQSTLYYGIVDDEYKFSVNVDYNSALKSFTIEEIVWEDESPPKLDKAVKRIMDIVYNWHPENAILYAKDY